MPRHNHIRSFLRGEDGSLLVFFAVCVITILGIVALSFDLGRRAATQTDMQAFVDNVALAAAGELDGSPGAIVNATTAANSVIQAANERLKAGTAGQDFEIALDQILFYEDLPATDTPGSFEPEDLSNPDSDDYKYALPPSDLGETPAPERARYVGIRLATVDVAWVFAGVFSASDLPDQAIGAVAVAGAAVWTCDVAPLLFCLPEGAGGAPVSLVPGQAANLRTARQNTRWRPGEFGFVDVDIDPTGECAGLTDEAGRQACLITARSRFAACFQPQRSRVQTGQRPSQESAAFDMPFDFFDQSMVQFFNDPFYAPGAHTVSGRLPDASGDICVPGRASLDTMAFPLDDCHETACVDGRFGDGVWTAGRDAYVETNYTVYEQPYDEGDPVEDRTVAVDGSFFDFPEPGLTRYQFYLREIERAANGGIMSGRYAGVTYATDDDGVGESSPGTATGPFYTTWDDYWPDDSSPDAFNPIIPDAHSRADNGLPRCNLNTGLTPSPERRVLLAAGIHCPRNREDRVVGFDDDVEILDFYRLFQLGPTENVSGFPERFDLNVEVIERLDVPTDRRVVQLYR